MNPSFALLLVPLVFTVHPVQDPNSTPARPSDPTSIDAGLQRALSLPESGRAGAGSVAPFPAVAIRGVVVAHGGAALAVLEVDSARVRVKPGTVIPFGNGDRLRVDAISADEVVLVRESTGEGRALR